MLCPTRSKSHAEIYFTACAKFARIGTIIVIIINIIIHEFHGDTSLKQNFTRGWIAIYH